MTLQGTIQWGQGDVAVVDSAEAFDELLARLQTLACRHPFLIDLIASDGRSLVLGLGRDKAVLSLAGPEGSPPYFASIGDESAEGDMSFNYHGEPTDFRLCHVVPILAARMAATQFLSEPELPEAVRWVEI